MIKREKGIVSIDSMYMLNLNDSEHSVYIVDNEPIKELHITNNYFPGTSERISVIKQMLTSFRPNFWTKLKLAFKYLIANGTPKNITDLTAGMVQGD